jgi:structural maintenance of chromosome 4
MKPKAPSEHEDGLLEYLEDIIGTAKYKEPIDEAMIEVERLHEDRQVKLNRLRLVEKEKAALEERKKEAEDYLRLKNQLAMARSREIQWSLWKLFEMETNVKGRIVSKCCRSQEVNSSFRQTAE